MSNNNPELHHRWLDLTGQRFGKLTVLERTDEKEDRYAVWMCRCDCGNICKVNTKRLKRGTIESCGCIPKQDMRFGPKSVDLTGMRFGKLTALRRVENKGKYTAWMCRCDCGKEKVVTTHDLRAGHTKSCGCMSHRNMPYRDLTGQKIEMLTVLEKTEKRDAKGSIIWRCQCDCGNECFYTEDALIHGNTVSCGCYRKGVLPQKMQDSLHRVDGTCVERLLQQKARTDNRSGHVGIHLTKDNRYYAMIGFRGKRYNLGTYSNLEDALKARRRGEEMHIDFLEKYHETER